MVFPVKCRKSLSRSERTFYATVGCESAVSFTGTRHQPIWAHACHVAHLFGQVRNRELKHHFLFNKLSRRPVPCSPVRCRADGGRRCRGMRADRALQLHFDLFPHPPIPSLLWFANGLEPKRWTSFATRTLNSSRWKMADIARRPRHSHPASQPRKNLFH